ncbi:MAG: hypothetical protein K0S38_964, partial [Candidatus Paceibacter sp.]|nr:hypothetical protein [Candidatus Paceibacter sp.]
AYEDAYPKYKCIGFYTTKSVPDASWMTCYGIIKKVGK